MAFPLDEVNEVVLTHDYFERFVGMLLAEVKQRMDCKTRLRKMKFNVGSLDLIVIIHGGAHHVIPVEFVQQPPAWFKWILGGDYHPHFVEVRCFRHDVGNDQMTNMDRVEGAEEETCFQRLFGFPGELNK